MNMIHYVVVELKNDHQSEKYISRKSSRPVNQRLKLTLFMVQPAILTNPLDFLIYTELINVYSTFLLQLSISSYWLLNDWGGLMLQLLDFWPLRTGTIFVKILLSYSITCLV